MVSQSSGQQESPMNSWEGIGSDSSDAIDSFCLLDTERPHCQLDVRLRRHKAAWINPPCVQPLLPLQDLPSRMPTVGDNANMSVADATPPLSPSPPFLRDSSGETELCEDTADCVGGVSAQGSGEKNNDFSLTSTGCSRHMSLLASSRCLGWSRCSEVGGAFLEPSHLPEAADRGDVQVTRRTASLNSFSPEAFMLPVDVEKENAHFYVADAIISAMEKVKCNILGQQQAEGWDGEEAGTSSEHSRANSEATFPDTKQESGSSASSDSDYEGCAIIQARAITETPAFSDVVKEACKCDFDDFVILELGELNDIIETCRCSCNSTRSINYEPDFNAAELLAKELYQVFRKCWMLSVADCQLTSSLNAASSIVVNEDCVRQDFEASVDIVEEIKLKSKIRETEGWAPPRFQIILTVHPSVKRDLVVAAQNFFCAGCGTPVEPKFVKRLRYCEYLGKYFCDCCHSHVESCIPARILMMWDFKKYHVSNFSKRLLDSIWPQPIFNLQSLSHSLYVKAKELDRVKGIREQLFHIKKLLKTCRFAHSVLKEFEHVPRHLTDELHLFSLEDLVKIKKGLLTPSLKDILRAALTHVASCELCQGKGFICEFCRSASVIFPFQTTTCRRCSGWALQQRTPWVGLSMNNVHWGMSTCEDMKAAGEA
ncbi:protein associated with UVRAG as autophagy enhancer isoform X2 [Ochotona curzoniae]|uniref:protein associated with UVRAG as autophagy enhancer isoform X2 n=1 Tax=Ochotona curzoniae TaxID=130825 RepID=UPI001B347C3C|nr:protein associated with UVRAG as autophagy enhancer isoform X2 [Ochotona curzoniae]